MARLNLVNPVPNDKRKDILRQGGTYFRWQEPIGESNSLIPRCAEQCLKMPICSWFWYYEQKVSKDLSYTTCTHFHTQTQESRFCTFFKANCFKDSGVCNAYVGNGNVNSLRNLQAYEKIDFPADQNEIILDRIKSPDNYREITRCSLSKATVHPCKVSEVNRKRSKQCLFGYKDQNDEHYDSQKCQCKSLSFNTVSQTEVTEPLESQQKNSEKLS